MVTRALLGCAVRLEEQSKAKDSGATLRAMLRQEIAASNCPEVRQDAANGCWAQLSVSGVQAFQTRRVQLVVFLCVLCHLFGELNRLRICLYCCSFESCRHCVGHCPAQSRWQAPRGSFWRWSAPWAAVCGGRLPLKMDWETHSFGIFGKLINSSQLLDAYASPL